MKDRIFAVRPGFNSLWLTLEAATEGMLKRVGSGKIFQQMVDEVSQEDCSFNIELVHHKERDKIHRRGAAV